MIPLLAAAILCQPLATMSSSWQEGRSGGTYQSTAAGDLFSAQGASLSVTGRMNPPVGSHASVTAAFGAADLQGTALMLTGELESIEVDVSASVCIQFENATGSRIVTLTGPPDLSVGKRPVALDGSRYRKFEAAVTVPPWAAVVRIGLLLQGSGTGLVKSFRVTSPTGRSLARFDDVTRATQSVAASIEGAPVNTTIMELADLERRFQRLWFISRADPDEMHAVFGRVPPPGLERGGRSLADSLAAEILLRQSAGGPGAYGHCHVSGGGGAMAPEFDGYVVRSGKGLHAVCPSWLLSPRRYALEDEAAYSDTLIAPRLASYVRAERAALLGVLSKAAANAPANDWLVGQRIRYLVDARDTATATRAAGECRAAAWWCGMLRGYVRHWAGDVRAADSSVKRICGLRARRAIRSMRSSGGCRIRSSAIPSTVGARSTTPDAC
jgi:hypothetical protein